MQLSEKTSVMRRFLICTAGSLSIVALAVFACQSTNAETPKSTTPPTTTSPVKVAKLLVFVEENHSLSQMKSGMPYAFGLAKQYGYATKYTAITHPSLPNYIAIAGGQTYGIKDNKAPSSHKISGKSVFGQAIAARKTAAIYADGMPSNCATSNGGSSYVVKHNPWAYFTNERTLCKKYDRPISSLGAAITNGTLPNVGMVIPNLRHDAHDGSLGTADNWFKGWMTKIFAGKDWKSGRLAVVLTADEDDKHAGNAVLTVVIHPSQKRHVVSSPLTHYSLTRLYEEVTRTSFLNKAAAAPSMAKAFGLPITP